MARPRTPTAASPEPAAAETPAASSGDDQPAEPNQAGRADALEAARSEGYEEGFAAGFASAAERPLPVFEEAKRVAGGLRDASERDVREAIAELCERRGEQLARPDVDLLLVEHRRRQTQRRAHQDAVAQLTRPRRRGGELAPTAPAETTYEHVR